MKAADNDRRGLIFNYFLSSLVSVVLVTVVGAGNPDYILRSTVSLLGVSLTARHVILFS